MVTRELRALAKARVTSDFWNDQAGTLIPSTSAVKREVEEIETVIDYQRTRESVAGVHLTFPN
jgi:hypothetical protein